MLRFLFLTIIFTFPQVALSSECTMNPAPINIKQVTHNTAIKSYVVDKGKLALTALLINGRALRLVHSGCDHSGAEASLWLDTDIPFSNIDAWLKEANGLARIAFAPDIANDIANNLKSGRFEKTTAESRVVISASSSSFMSYTIVISRAEHGLLLTIAYVLG